MPLTLKCINCGDSFQVQPKDAGRKFCGSACYRMYEKVHGSLHKPTEPLHFTCANCGKPFSHMPGHVRSYRSKFGRDPLYCSIVCGGEGRRLSKGLNCVECGKPVEAVWDGSRTMNRRNILCSAECRSAHKVKEIERLRPSEQREITRTVARHGYIRLRFPNKNGVKGREILEHRFVMEKRIGRPLLPDETVHHVNGDKTDNADSNLELFSSRHGPGQRVVDKVAFAIEVLNTYPEFASEAGYKLVKTVTTHDAEDLLSLAS